jgi:hypothetical protein
MKEQKALEDYENSDIVVEIRRRLKGSQYDVFERALYENFTNLKDFEEYLSDLTENGRKKFVNEFLKGLKKLPGYVDSAR